MEKKNKKRIISVVLSFVVALSFVFTQNVSLRDALGLDKSSGMIEEGAAGIDILLNAGVGSSVYAGDLHSLTNEEDQRLKNAIEALLLERAGEIENAKIAETLRNTQVRISLPTVNLDTTDLDDWYVYDHYDTGITTSGLTQDWEPKNNIPDKWVIQKNNVSNPPTGNATNTANSKAYYDAWQAGEAGTGTDADIANALNTFNAGARPSTSNLNHLPVMTIDQWVNRTFAKSSSDLWNNMNTFVQNDAGTSAKYRTGYHDDGRPHFDARSTYHPNAIGDSLGYFDRHILSHKKEITNADGVVVETVAAIDFVGYSVNGYQDFVMYPSTSAEVKEVIFEIDGSSVNNHTLDGAGFLINAGITGDNPTTGNLTGYLLYYQYGGNSASESPSVSKPGALDKNMFNMPSSLKLYEYNGNVSASKISGNSTGYAFSVSSGKNNFSTGGTGSGVATAIGNTSITDSVLRGDIGGVKGENWATKMEIRLTISPSLLIVEQRPIPEDGVRPDFAEVGRWALDATKGTHGFGPYVGYLSHGCVAATQFTFSNLRMAYVDQSDEIFDILSNNNFVANSDKYFVDLTDNGKNRHTSASADQTSGAVASTQGRDAAAYMQVNDISYITNGFPTGDYLPTDGKQFIENNGPNWDDAANRVPGTVDNPQTPLVNKGLDANGIGLTGVEDSDGNALDEPKTTPPRGNEGFDAYVDDLINRIAEYIVSTYIAGFDESRERPQTGAQLPVAKPVAILKVVTEDSLNDGTAANKNTFITTIKRDLVDPNGGLPLHAYNAASVPSTKSDGTASQLKRFDYVITKPGGFTIGSKDNPVTYTANLAAINPALPELSITTDRNAWPVGKYTVEMRVWDNGLDEDYENNPNVSTWVKFEFEITEDIIPPTVTGVEMDFTPNSNATPAPATLAFSTRDVGGYGVEKYELVFEPRGVGITDFSALQNKAASTVTTVPGTTDTGQGSWNYVSGGALTVTIPTYDKIPDSTKPLDTNPPSNEIRYTDIPLPLGEYTAKLIVYDVAGNKTIIDLPTVDYVNEKLVGVGTVDTGTLPTITPDASGNYPVAPGNVPKYTTVNSLAHESGTGSYAGITNTTDITVKLPGRGAAPESIILIDYGSGLNMTGATNAMEYFDAGSAASPSEPDKLSPDYVKVVTAADGIVYMPGVSMPKTYYVRYSAVPGAGFSSTNAKVDGSNVNYVVSFDLRGGIYNGSLLEEVPVQYVSAGAVVAKPAPSPTKQRYSFEGWYTDSDSTNPSAYKWAFSDESIPNTVSQSMTLYARWKQVYVNVIVELKLDNAAWAGKDLVITPADGSSVDHGGVHPPAASGADGKLSFWLKPGTYEFKAGGTTDGITQTIVIGATDSNVNITVNYLSVEFDARLGSPNPTTQYVLYGKSAIKPNDVQSLRPGATNFGGWCIEGGGWSLSDTDGEPKIAWNFANPVEESMKLYAKYFYDTSAPLTDVVFDPGFINVDPAKASNVTIKIMQGYEVIYESLTLESDGSFIVPNGLPEGIYNFEITLTDKSNPLVVVEVVRTIFVEVFDDTAVIDFRDLGGLLSHVDLTDGAKNSVVEVIPNANPAFYTPKVAQRGVHELVSSSTLWVNPAGEQDAFGEAIDGVTQDDIEVVTAGGALEVKLFVEGFDEANTSWPNQDTAIPKLKNEARKEYRTIELWLDVWVNKYLWYDADDYFNSLRGQSFIGNPDSRYKYYADEVNSMKNLPENHLIEVHVPLAGTALDKKTDVAVYRYHNNNAEQLGKTSAKANKHGEYFEHNIDKNTIVLHVRRFSEFAFAGASSGVPSGDNYYPPTPTRVPATPVPVVLASNNQLVIEATVGISGTITDTGKVGTGGTITDLGKTSVNPGASKEYIIKPDKGYRILDVFVDGVSVGGVTSYTFTDINENRTINAIFTDENNYIIEAVAGSGGSTTNPGRKAYAPFTNHKYTFMPDEGYYVQDVLIDGISVGSMYNYIIDSLEKDVTIEVLFARKINIKLNSYDHYSYIVGYPDGTVQPEGSITREEVAAIFFRLLTEESRDFYFTRENAFEDVAIDRWSNSSISTLANAGILVGRNPSGTLFDPSGKITRAEVVSMAVRFFEAADGSSDRFSDIAGHWGEADIKSADAREWLVEAEWEFRPDDFITRSETMAVINRVLNRLPETPADLHDDMLKWIDNTDTAAWYYLHIQEATNSHNYYKKSDEKHETWTEIKAPIDWSAWN